jgi:HemY protein
VDRLWGRLPAAMRKAPRLIAQQGIALNALGQGEEAEKKIRQALKRGWEESLVLAYGRVRGAKADKQLRQAEYWLKDRPEDPALLLTAARLCMVLELWGKARSYLETSLVIDPRTDAYALYGRLLDQFGEADNAALAFRSGLSLVVGAADDLPALDAPDAIGQAGRENR